MNIRFDYDTVPTILSFAQSDKFIRGLMGPFGSGKSSGCVMEIIKRGLQQKPHNGVKKTRWAVIRNTYRQLEDTTIRTFFDWLPPSKFGKYRVQTHDYTIQAFKDCEIEVLFRALDRPEHVSNLLSLELTGAWINEAREVPEAIFKALQGRVGRYPSVRGGGCTWQGIFMDTNPPDSDSWWYKLFEEVRPENAEIFKQPSGLAEEGENKQHLPKNYYENLAAGKDEEFVRVYVNGEYGFILDGKPVYPEYKDHVHCKEFDVVKGLTIRRGWDFGLTPSVSMSQMAPNGQWRIIDEIVGDNIAVDRFSDDVVSYCSRHYPNFPFHDFGDPAGDIRSQADEKTCFQILRAKGIYIEPGEQDPGLRIESVKKPLNSMIEGEPALIIHPRCKVLRKGFRGGYRYRRMQTRYEQHTDKPEKNEYSHCFAAGTLVSTPLGRVPIEKVVVGDYVNTPVGPKRVLETMTNRADTIDLSFSDGVKITCTPDHPFLGIDGIVRADALQYAVTEYDEVTAKWLDQQNTKYNISRASRITKNQRGTISRIITSMVGAICTELYGRHTTERYQTGVVSTTRTTIREIMTSLTWNASRFLVTPLTIQTSGSEMATRPFYAGSLRPRKRRSSGMAPTRGKNGTQNMANKHGRAGNLLSILARFAARNMKPTLSGKAIALTFANPRRAEIPVSITKKGSVSNVAGDFQSINIQKQRPARKTAPKVCGVKPSGRREVFDLTVEDAHCFYANGFLVHNCHDALQYDATRLFGYVLQTPKKREEKRKRSRLTSWMAA